MPIQVVQIANIAFGFSRRNLHANLKVVKHNRLKSPLKTPMPGLTFMNTNVLGTQRTIRYTVAFCLFLNSRNRFTALHTTVRATANS